MKYDAKLIEMGNLLSTAKNILVALPADPSIDDLAAGLALFLSLEQAGKTAAIVTEGVIRVGHTQLFGVGQIQNRLPQISGGNLVLVLGGVVMPGIPPGQNPVPSLEKVRWYPSGNDLHLVFEVVPGQKFEPTQITPRQEGGGFDLIFTVGSITLSTLGSIYNNNQQVFQNTPIINLDNKQTNTNFAQINIVDPASSSVSEIIAEILPSLQLPLETDIASNALAGIFAATSNLQSSNVAADTYTVVAAAVRVGGQKPVASEQATGTIPMPTQPQVSGVVENFTMPQVVPPTSSGIEQKIESQQATPPTASSEEVPTGEVAETALPELDWLTPKIFKGSSIG